MKDKTLVIEDDVIKNTYELIKNLIPDSEYMNNEKLKETGGFKIDLTEYKLNRTRDESITILKKLKEFELIEFSGMDGWKMEKNPNSGVLVKVPLLSIKFLEFVDIDKFLRKR